MARFIFESTPSNFDRDIRTPFRVFTCRIGDLDGGASLVPIQTKIAVSVPSRYNGVPVVVWMSGIATASRYFPTTLVPDLLVPSTWVLVIRFPDGYAESGETVQVIVTAQPSGGLLSSDSVSFTTWDAPSVVGPQLRNCLPVDGALDVLPDASVSFDVVDSSGLDVSSLVVEVDEGSGWKTVYDGLTSSFMFGWSGSVVPDVPVPLVPTSVHVDLVRPVTSPTWPRGATSQVRVTAADVPVPCFGLGEDLGFGIGACGRVESFGSVYPREDTVQVNTSVGSFSFTVIPAVRVLSVTFVSEFSFVVRFSGPVQITAALTYPTSYTVTPIGAYQAAFVRSAHCEQVDYPTSVSVETSVLQTRGTYLVTVVGDIRDQWGDPLDRAGCTASFRTWRTKVDEHDSALASSRKRRGGTPLLSVMSAIGLADDDIGGDFGWWNTK